jgi:hypothetical protein
MVTNMQFIKQKRIKRIRKSWMEVINKEIIEFLS